MKEGRDRNQFRGDRTTRLGSIQFDSNVRERERGNAMNNGRWEWYLFFLFLFFFSPRSILGYIENTEEEEFSIIDCWKRNRGEEEEEKVRVIDYWPSRVSPCGKREYGDSVWSMCIYIEEASKWVHVSRKGIFIVYINHWLLNRPTSSTKFRDMVPRWKFVPLFFRSRIFPPSRLFFIVIFIKKWKWTWIISTCCSRRKKTRKRYNFSIRCRNRYFYRFPRSIFLQSQEHGWNKRSTNSRRCSTNEFRYSRVFPPLLQIRPIRFKPFISVAICISIFFFFFFYDIFLHTSNEA